MQYTTNFKDGHFEATLSESFTFQDNASFRDIIAQIQDKHVTQITCHIQGVDFVDSAALGMFLLLRDIAEKAHASITLTGASGQVKKMFEISKFSELFTVK